MTAALVALLRDKRLRVTTAESCTGGMVAAAITDIPGSSTVFERGFVTYADSAKIEMLGVPAALIANFGAVSEAVALSMAAGALAYAAADLAVSVTGIAGPDGGSAAKPVGTVWFALAAAGAIATHHRVFPGDRAAIRLAARDFALGLVFAAARQG